MPGRSPARKHAPKHPSRRAAWHPFAVFVGVLVLAGAVVLPATAYWIVHHPGEGRGSAAAELAADALAADGLAADEAATAVTATAENTTVVAKQYKTAAAKAFEPDGAADAGQNAAGRSLAMLDPGAGTSTLGRRGSRGLAAMPANTSPVASGRRTVFGAHPLQRSLLLAQSQQPEERDATKGASTALMYASATPDDLDPGAGAKVDKSFSLSDLDGRTALYDIEGHTVYMPGGEKLEAHSGLGNRLDDTRYVHEKNRGPTPPDVYDLKLRESLFHGVQAVRLNPVSGANPFGRTGLLAHTYMLGDRGDSNGCVSIKEYQKFLRAVSNGEVTRLVVVKRWKDAPSAFASSSIGKFLKYAFGS